MIRKYRILLLWCNGRLPLAKKISKRIYLELRHKRFQRNRELAIAKMQPKDKFDIVVDKYLSPDFYEKHCIQFGKNKNL